MEIEFHAGSCRSPARSEGPRRSMEKETWQAKDAMITLHRIGNAAGRTLTGCRRTNFH